MQEELEQRTVSVSIQAAKLSGRVLKAAIAAALQKMEHSRNTPKVGRNSMKRLTARDPGASTIEVTGRIRSFERIAKKHEVRYHIEKDPGTDPPKWTVYFKANQADALTAAGLGPAYNILDGFEGGHDADGHRTVSGWKNAGLPWRQG